MRVVLWQNIVSPHLVPAFRALAARVENVDIVAARAMARSRAESGWQVPDVGRATLVLGPDAAAVAESARKAPRDSVHLFGDARLTAMGREAMSHCAEVGARVGLISEGADPAGWKGGVRRLKYGLERISTGRRFDFVLAMGQQGVRWFRECGYGKARVFPFAYFTDHVPVDGAGDARSDGPFELVYVGQFVRRKGVDVLLQALSALPSRDWRLTLIGDGPERPSLERMTNSLELGERIRFLGSLPNDSLRDRLQAFDLLVLPSRFDGWGAVVNEALMCGVPVVCSDRCGAADLLGQSWRGAVFRTGSAPALAEVLAARMAAGRIDPGARQRIRRWSSSITGGSASDYVLAVLQHVYEGAVRPVPPWRAA